ncbi:MAG: LysR family transcriptional regulator [Polyangiaceae bacterium]
MHGSRQMPSLDDIAVFVKVIEEGSVSAAARRLGLPKSTVSRRLTQLEEVLGAQLVRRSGRGLSLTDVGRSFSDAATGLLADMEELVELAGGHAAAPRGRLRVSAPADLAALSEAWIGFAERYPEVELELSFSNRYVDVVSEGFDLALRGGRGEDQSLVARSLGTYSLRAVASPEHVARAGKPSGPAEIKKHDCVLLHPFRQRTGTLPRGRSAGRGRHTVVSDLSAALLGAIRGLGIAILPAYVCDGAIAEGKLVPVLDEWNPLRVPIYAVYPERRFLSAAARVFLDHVSGALAAC